MALDSRPGAWSRMERVERVEQFRAALPMKQRGLARRA
ncbi:hypothetical protein BN2475_50029 [Paraburkholderia ribeironis]|uniref:Uncharacterized protein n=1 Tax=Paraburkholderia ribeironis TaxID=1247936 RepID=A0A1N7RK20_9BURK|nr:hypothetical protein BN2475_50029 [Paraburkholderia ribeironis]